MNPKNKIYSQKFYPSEEELELKVKIKIIKKIKC